MSWVKKLGLSRSKKCKLEDVLGKIKSLEDRRDLNYERQIELYDLKKKVVFRECKGKPNGKKNLVDRIKAELSIESGFKSRKEFEGFVSNTVFSALPRLATEGKVDSDAVAELLVLSEKYGKGFLPVGSVELEYDTFNVHQGGAFYRINVALPNDKSLVGHVKKVPKKRYAIKSKVREAVASFSDDILPPIHSHNGYFVDFYKESDVLQERIMQYKREGNTDAIKRDLVEALRIIKRLGESGLANIERFREKGKMFVPVVDDYVGDAIREIVLPGVRAKHLSTYGNFSEKNFRKLLEEDDITKRFVDAFTQDYVSMPKYSYFGNGDPHAQNFIYDGDRLKLIDWDFARFGIPRYAKLFSMLGLEASLEREIVIEALGEDAWKPYLKEKMVECLKAAVINYVYLKDSKLTPDDATVEMRKDKIKYYYTVAKKIASKGMAVGSVMDNFFQKWFGEEFSAVDDCEFADLSSRCQYDDFTVGAMDFTALDPKLMSDLRQVWDVGVSELEVSQRRRGIAKWVGGVATAVVGTALISYLLLAPELKNINPAVELIDGAPKLVMTEKGLMVEEGGGQFHSDYVLDSSQMDERSVGGEFSTNDYLRLHYAFGALKHRLRWMAEEAGIEFEQARDLLLSHYMKNPMRGYKLNLHEDNIHPDYPRYPYVINRQRFGIIPITSEEYKAFTNEEYVYDKNIIENPETTMKVAFRKLKRCIDEVVAEYGTDQHRNGDSEIGRIGHNEIFSRALVVYAIGMDGLKGVLHKCSDEYKGEIVEDNLSIHQCAKHMHPALAAFLWNAGDNYVGLGDDPIDNIGVRMSAEKAWGLQSIYGSLFGFSNGAEACSGTSLFKTFAEQLDDIESKFERNMLWNLDKYHDFFYRGDEPSENDSELYEILSEKGLTDGTLYKLFSAVLHSNLVASRGNVERKGQFNTRGDVHWLVRSKANGGPIRNERSCSYEAEVKSLPSVLAGTLYSESDLINSTVGCGAHVLQNIWKMYEGQQGAEAKAFAHYFSDGETVKNAIDSAVDSGYWDRYYDWRMFLPQEVRESTDRALFFYPLMDILNGDNITGGLNFHSYSEYLQGKKDDFVLESMEVQQRRLEEQNNR